MAVENHQFSPSLDRKYVIADMIIGYGVSESIFHHYNLWNESLAGKKIIVQSWGNVGSAGAYYLAQHGAKTVGTIDRVGGLINEDAFSLEEIRELFLNKNGNQLNVPNLLSYDEVNTKKRDVTADVFIPCAGSRMITQNQVERMIAV